MSVILLRCTFFAFKKSQFDPKVIDAIASTQQVYTCDLLRTYFWSKYVCWLRETNNTKRKVAERVLSERMLR